MRSRLWLCGWAWAVCPGLALFFASGPIQAEPEPETVHSHDEALQVPTEDPVLKEQIAKIHAALQDLHIEMARLRKELQTPSLDDRRAGSLYGQLDGLRKEHDSLERLLHELVEEAQATEWTEIDEALKRVKQYEQTQERQYRQEEVLRDRQS